MQRLYLFVLILLAGHAYALAAAVRDGTEEDADTVAVNDGRPSEIVPTIRQLAILSVSTSYSIITATVTSTVKSLCASLVNVTGACQRRRRGVVDKPVVLSFDEEDHIDLYNPSPILPVAPTADPASSMSRRSAEIELESSREVQSEEIEVDIIGLQNNCVMPRFGFGNVLKAFGVTLRSTTTLQATITTTKTITNGKATFFVSGCTPNPFAYSTC